MKARFWITQYIDDPIDNDSQNVGVIVSVDGKWAAKFIGENAKGRFALKRVRSFPFPDIYRQWVKHWRLLMRQPDFTPAMLIASSKANYRVVSGGTFDPLTLTAKEAATMMYRTATYPRQT